MGEDWSFVLFVFAIKTTKFLRYCESPENRKQLICIDISFESFLLNYFNYDNSYVENTFRSTANADDYPGI